jgi:hypothetical protein
MPQRPNAVTGGLKAEMPAVLLVLLFVGVAVAGVWLQFDRAVESRERVGVLEALHQIQGNTGSNYSMFYVRLAEGQLVSVVAPEMTPFVKGRPVRVIESTTGLGRVSYGFAGYADAASNSTAETDARKSGARGSP